MPDNSNYCLRQPQRPRNPRFLQIAKTYFYTYKNIYTPIRIGCIVDVFTQAIQHLSLFKEILSFYIAFVNPPWL